MVTNCAWILTPPSKGSLNSQQETQHPSCNDYAAALPAVVFLILLMAKSFCFSHLLRTSAGNYQLHYPELQKTPCHQPCRIQCTWKRLDVQWCFTRSNCCALRQAILVYHSFCRSQQHLPVEHSINFFTPCFSKKPRGNLNPPYLATLLSCCVSAGFTLRFCGTMFSYLAQNWLGERQRKEVFSEQARNKNGKSCSVPDFNSVST